MVVVVREYPILGIVIIRINKSLPVPIHILVLFSSNLLKECLCVSPFTIDIQKVWFETFSLIKHTSLFQFFCIFAVNIARYCLDLDIDISFFLKVKSYSRKIYVLLIFLLILLIYRFVVVEYRVP